MSAAERTFKSVLGGEGEGSSITYIKAKDLAESGVTGLVAQGIYEGPQPNNFDDTKSDYKLRLDDGTLTIINTTGSLANQMNRVAPGSYIQVNYNGMDEITKGKMAGKKAHAFEVLVAE
jgi:hypothetical protein